MSSLSSLSVIIPAYNEEANLAPTLLAAKSALHPHLTGKLEWILVDDGSQDGTWQEITRMAQSDSNVIPIKHSTNQGLGVAVWSGLTHADCEWCTWTPADGQIDPQALADMIQLANKAELVMLMREESKRAWGRRVLTLGLDGLMRLFLGFDVYGYSGVFLVRRQLLQDARLRCTTGLQNVAIVLHCQKKGCRTLHAHTVLNSRMSGKSKVTNLPTMIKTFYEAIKFRFTD